VLFASKTSALKLFPNPASRNGPCFSDRGMEAHGTHPSRFRKEWEALRMCSMPERTPIFHPLMRSSSVRAYTAARSTDLSNPISSKNAASFSNRIKALFIVCGGGDTPRAQGSIDALAKSCGAKPVLTKVFPGRLMKRLLNQEDYRIEEEVANKYKPPYEDYDSLQRKDCLKFGEEILTKV